MSDLFGKLEDLRFCAEYEKQEYYADRLKDLIDEDGWHFGSKKPDEPVEAVIYCQRFENGACETAYFNIAIWRYDCWMLPREQDKIMPEDVICWMPIPDTYLPKGE